MIHHFWGSSPSRRRDGRQRSAGVYPTTLSWRKRKESREQSCAETLPHIHMCLYIHTYTLIYVHIYKYTQLYGYICVHITRTKMSQGASFFVGFFLSLSLLPGICLLLLRARAQRNTRRSRGCLLGKGGRRPANRTADASATWSSSSPPTATVEKEGGPLRRKQKGCIPSRPARAKRGRNTFTSP